MNTAEVHLFVGKKGTAVKTDAIDADSFVAALVDSLSAELDVDDDRRRILLGWISQSFDIIAKLKGYKANGVNESRLLWVGDVSPWDVPDRQQQSEGEDISGLIEEAMGYYDVDDDDKLHQLMWFAKRNFWMLDDPDLLDEELAAAMRSVLAGKNPKTGEKLKVSSR